MVVAASVFLPMQGTHTAIGLSLGVREFSAITTFFFFPTHPPVEDISFHMMPEYIISLILLSPGLGILYYVQRFWQLSSSWDISLCLCLLVCVTASIRIMVPLAG